MRSKEELMAEIHYKIHGDELLKEDLFMSRK
jgi:hypothetical protein